MRTIDLITVNNYFMWECNDLAHRSSENKRNVGICWAKSLTDFKLDATYAHIMQHSPTGCTNERNMLRPTCCANMLRSFPRALTPIFMALIFCCLTDCQKLCYTYSLFVSTSLDEIKVTLQVITSFLISHAICALTARLKFSAKTKY